MALMLNYDASLSQAYGARPLRRAVTAIVENPLAEALLHSRVTAGQTAVVDRADDGTITVRTCALAARAARQEPVQHTHLRALAACRVGTKDEQEHVSP